MEDEKIEKRNKNFKPNIQLNDFTNQPMNIQLTLRKQKLEENLMSKRIKFIKGNPNPLVVDINKLNVPEDLKKNYKTFLKKNYEIKNYLHQLFGSDLNDKKLALFLLRNFIILQITELPFEKRKLSRNDRDLFKRLCDLLYDQDPQVKYEVTWCLINISLFPKVVENKLYTEENLNKILDFILTCDDQFIINSIFMLRNFSTNDSNRHFFINNGGLKKAIDILSKDINNLYLIKHICSFFQNLTNILENEPYEIENLIEIILLLIKVINNFINNPLNNEKDYLLIIELLHELMKNQNKQIYSILINTNFCETIIKFFNIIHDNDIRIKTFEIFNDMLSYDDTINQKLLNAGLCKILKDLLNEFQFNNKKFLAEIIFAISNISNGLINQIELLNKEGKFYDIIKINKFYIENYNPNDDSFKNLIREGIYALSNAVNLSQNNSHVIQNILFYENGFLIQILLFALKNFDLKKENEIFFYSIILCIKICIIQSENFMNDNDNFIKIYLINNQIEDILNHLLTNKYLITDANKNIIDTILCSLKDENDLNNLENKN